ncbi:ventral expressed homeobox [Danio rerio]|uniref:Homeobox protein Vega2 n=1 Tax=Danio rerio TaxID=7955 RepID=Q9DGM9_DANRE|nr:ventral expressed homeobox [Danio rerio]AAG02408.1 vent [Danio rerio]AAK37442.1 homeobox protein Vega2 [Danio rerio]|eukprot:NP_571775.1 homeobox protein VENTX [Danio rerio]
MIPSKFSVEWLSQSFHDQEKCSTAAPGAPLTAAAGAGKAPASPANSCGYTDVESDDSEVEAGQNRRVRTKFTCDQISGLEKSFSKHRYLGATQRRKIAEKLHLSETQVKTWFQNRRMKLKREVQDMRAADFLYPAVFPPMTSLQHQSVGYYHQQQPQHITHPMLFTRCYF